MNSKNQFNPDDLVLTKQDVQSMLDDIESRGKKNKKQNCKLILSLNEMKSYISLSSEETIKALWYEIVKEIN